MKPTPLMEILNISKPIICAPLAGGSSPEFMAELVRVGSIGAVSVSFTPLDRVVPRLQKISDATGGKFAVNLSLLKDQKERLIRALDTGVKVISVWQNDPTEYIKLAKDAGATVIWTVGSAEDAKHARDMGVDILVAQGGESGGHLVGRSPIMSLLPAVVDAANGVPVAAAGGIADGRGLAAALCLGAQAVWMGSRFVASKEVTLHEGYKDLVVKATADDVIDTFLFDVDCPDSRHRVLRTDAVKRWEDAGRPESGKRPGEGEIVGKQPDGTPLQRYHVSAPAKGFEGDWAATALYAGTSVQLIHDVLPVEKIVSDMVADASAALKKAPMAIEN
ncbi:Dioxygenases related to 2-nitropropane dioxygenase [Paraburkholderia caribensis MBA4]|uniref:Dioxygenases related to 2-nitropropane dioxygenase n=1 Tax=Paraburkholderia caribensis MBA4 TaxID=1323664 RepID=A0A0P0RIC7_9BURK|nr:nitronate monooxygenase [Paraburkholderia caribensis]ALL68394.1 Dioxygenases related to 2-nitropropane dioxygenase [Paraburkholderia caribensis MBA4]